EQVQVAKEAVVAAFMSHVADRVNMDEETHSGNNKNHHAGEWVQQIAPIGDELSSACEHRDGTWSHPFEKNLLKYALAWGKRKNGDCSSRGMKKREEHATDAEKVDGLLRKQSANKKHERSRQQREERDEPQVLEEVVRGAHCS